MFKFNDNLMCSSAFTPSNYCYCRARNESGRSMVEMLGVLAIIGVLSVGGIAGYTSAMTKYKANELVNEVSQRAAMVAMQAAQGKTEFSIGEFGNRKVVDADLGVINVGTSAFAITVSKMDKALCQNIKNMIGNKTQIRHLALAESPETAITQCGDDGTAYALVYNNDLSAVDFVFDDGTDSPYYYKCEDRAGVLRRKSDDSIVTTIYECNCTNGKRATSFNALCGDPRETNNPAPNIYYSCDHGYVVICRANATGSEPCDSSGVDYYTCDCTNGVTAAARYLVCGSSEPESSNDISVYCNNDVVHYYYNTSGDYYTETCKCYTDGVVYLYREMYSGDAYRLVCEYEGPKWVCRDGLHVDRYTNGVLEIEGECTYTCQTGEILGPGDDPWCWRW